MRVVVADDSTVAREGIATIIRRDLRYALCGLARDRQSLTDLLEQQRPDLLLIEPFFGNHDGVFLKELAAGFPDTRILVISRRPEEIYARTRPARQASGYWMKTGPREELINAIETVLAGEESPDRRANANSAYVGADRIGQRVSPPDSPRRVHRCRHITHREKKEASYVFSNQLRTEVPSVLT